MLRGTELGTAACLSLRPHRPFRGRRCTARLSAARAPVDVSIITYNESREVLERTIIGASAIEHRDLRICVLDDGARRWVQELAATHGAEYVCSVRGKHAKAGNLNNGLRHALTAGRRPQFILLLDADFIPSGRILRRTLGLFEDEDVGTVQTPQHLFTRIRFNAT